MLVVSNTSPINYLLLIREIDILARMYGNVVIPHTVRDELLQSSSPAIVRNWASRMPSWLEVRSPANSAEEGPSALHPGERDAISLAVEFLADLLIIDDRQGRREAHKRGILVMGTLGVLREAALLGLLDLRVALERLQNTSFYVAPDVLERLLNGKI